MQNSKSLDLYLKEMARYPLLGREEERKLSYQIREGDLYARERMIVSNLRLVVKMAFRYSRYGGVEDLIEEGNLGLIDALKYFDPEKGYRFSTYATWWVWQYVKRAAYRRWGVNSADRFPDSKNPDIQSLDGKNEGGSSPLEFIADENAENPEYAAMVRRDAETTKKAVRKSMKKLDLYGRDVLKRRFLDKGLEKVRSHRELMKYIPFSHERIRTMEKGAIRKLRKELGINHTARV